MPRTIALAALALLAICPVVPAAEPERGPISLKVELISEEFDLHTNGLQIHKYEEAIRSAERDGNPLPPTGMEMTLVFRNDSSEAVKMLVGGDETLLTFEVTGRAAVTADVNVTRDPAILAKVVTIPPRGTYRLTVENLSHGFRNQAKLTYLLGIGDYKLVATYRTAVSPAPNGAGQNGRIGFGTVMLKAEPVEFRTKKPS